MRVARDHHIHFIIQTLDDVDYRAGNGVGFWVGRAVIAGLPATLVQRDDNRAYTVSA